MHFFKFSFKKNNIFYPFCKIVVFVGILVLNFKYLNFLSYSLL